MANSLQNYIHIKKYFDIKNRNLLTPIHVIIFFIILIWVLRFISLGLYPLMDTTEARYAEIARIMEEKNDWITPWFDYGVPFWGKPPLSFWLTALSFRLFGVNELAARLPQFLCAAFVAWMVWDIGKRFTFIQALYALAFLSASALFFIAAGAVMTDMVLLVGMTISMRGFWLAYRLGNQNNAFEKYTFSIGLGLSLLAKGPIGLLLTYLSVLGWAAVTKNQKVAIQIVFWKKGLLLLLLMVLPWYILAEVRTPGFLNYFIIGEHWDRFFVPGWKGDLYGSGHHYPRGTIWLFLLADILPWTILIPAFLIFRKNKGNINRNSHGRLEWRLYLLFWFLASAFLFTFAKNILWPYVLPGLPALALLIGDWLEDLQDQNAVQKMLIQGLVITTFLPIIFFMSPVFNKRVYNKSAKAIIAEYEKYKNEDDKLLFFGKRSFSADFYSKGAAGFLSDNQSLKEQLRNETIFLAIKNGSESLVLGELINDYDLISKKGNFGLYKSRSP